MEQVSKLLFDKVSSYNILNNIFPGIVFCFLLKQLTSFNLSNESWLENLFMYYLFGMILSRVGSLIIEPILKKWKINNRKAKKREFFLKYALYSNYKEASKADPLIVTLSETNNTYRTLLATLICIVFCKLYEIIFYSLLSNNFPWIIDVGNWVVIVLVILLFLFAFQKQTDYIRKSVEDYISNKNQKM